jgi:hypothetical protein
MATKTTRSKKKQPEPIAAAVVDRPVQELRPYPNNPRTHSQEQVDQIAASIQKFGFRNPVLTHGDYIVAGHGRVAAARQLERETVPTIDMGDMSNEDMRAYIIADNQIALNADWDDGLLREELNVLLQQNFDLDLLGFKEADLTSLLGDPVDASEAWTGMPEYESDEQLGWKQIVVHFDTKVDYESFQKVIGQELTEKTKYIWFPPQPDVSRNDKRYAGSEAE